MIKEKKQQPGNFKERPPVVVVLGHVDHGKSSILEAIKDLKITSKESGGITQHIGAYEVEHQGKKITFIDTPGHEAFCAMRSRGAKVADIAVLVVAADEGIKPQTKEAIKHIRDCKIPMVAAINKIDLPRADSQKVKGELASEDILVEAMGGKILSADISAKTKQGIPELLELILLVAEMEELKGDISQPAKGVVIESYMDVSRGPIATLILQSGVLKEGDVIGTNTAVGKVKMLENFQGNNIKEALPSMPAIVLGFEKAPGTGEQVQAYPDIESARRNIKEEKPVFENPVNPGKRALNLILKVDFLGSLEAIEEVLKDLPQEKVVIKLLKAEVGEVTDSDVKLANGSKAKIIGFRVKTNPIARKLADREKITVINFEIIYELAQAVRNLLEKRVEPELVREDFGKVKILAIFRTEKNRQIIGGKVLEGKIKRGSSLEVYRNEELVGKGRIIKLQQEKKEVGELGKGSECGILYEGNVRAEEGDILTSYIEEKRKGEL